MGVVIGSQSLVKCNIFLQENDGLWNWMFEYLTELHPLNVKKKKLLKKIFILMGSSCLKSHCFDHLSSFSHPKI